jgi:CheY-like chemotaxis protein
MTHTNPASPFGVLLVEDDPVQRMNAAEALRAAGLDVVEAPGLDLAIAALDRHPRLRALVVDVELVGETMDGFAFAQAVAARWPALAILVVSGVRQPAEDQLPAGARFLSKPYEAQELASTVFSLVERRVAGLEEGPEDRAPDP